MKGSKVGIFLYLTFFAILILSSVKPSLQTYKSPPEIMISGNRKVVEGFKHTKVFPGRKSFRSRLEITEWIQPSTKYFSKEYTAFWKPSAGDEVDRPGMLKNTSIILSNKGTDESQLLPSKWTFCWVWKIRQWERRQLYGNRQLLQVSVHLWFGEVPV